MRRRNGGGQQVDLLVVSAARLRDLAARQAAVRAGEAELKRLRAAFDEDERRVIAELEGGAVPEPGGPLAAVHVTYQRHISWKAVCASALGKDRVRLIHEAWPKTKHKALVITQVASSEEIERLSRVAAAAGAA